MFPYAARGPGKFAPIGPVVRRIVCYVGLVADVGRVDAQRAVARINVCCAVFGALGGSVAIVSH
jgi:hypothetical protein